MFDQSVIVFEKELVYFGIVEELLLGYNPSDIFVQLLV